MEGEASSGQTRRGNSNQLHGQVERSSGARTPKTPCQGEKTRNYDGISWNSGGRSTRRINSSGERTPVSPCDQRSFHPGTIITSGERTPKCDQSNHGSVAKERDHKRERSGDEIKSHEAADDSRYGSGSNSVSRRQSFQSTSTCCGPSQRDLISSSGKRVTSRTTAAAEGRNRKQRKQHGKACETSTEDSACSIFRGHWKENTDAAATATPDDVQASKISVVQRFVDTQRKAFLKSGDIDEHDGKVFSEFKCEEKVFTKQKAVAAVLAFQRWRHTQLKRLFSLELKKVLEEAKEDEACLARLEQDLASKDRHIAQLRYQLTSYETASEAQMIQRHAIDANIKELQNEMLKALERAAKAEEEVHKRDCEIRRLKDRLNSLEDEGIRMDSELQSNLQKLLNDKESALNEGRVLLSQLSRRDEEVALQCKEIDKLRETIAHLSARHTTFQKEIDTLKAERRDEVNNLQEKLQHAFATGHAREMELVSYTEKSSGWDQERQNLLVQLHQALERADLASQRAEELQGKLHSSAEIRARASEQIAGEMIGQLKRLTGHMKELETSMDKTALHFPVGVFQKKAVAASLAKLSNKLAQAEAASMDILTHADTLGEPERSGPLPGKEDSRRHVCFTFPDEKNKFWAELGHIPLHAGKQSSMMTIDRDIAFTKFKNWITWKWRWAASATKAENLSIQLRLKLVETDAKDPISYESESQPERNPPKHLNVSQLDELLLTGNEKNRTLILKHRMGDLIVKHKLVPVMMMAWRAFARLSNLQRIAIARNESLEKIISALPWWIRRVGERRALERYFFHWQLLGLRANRERVQQEQQHKKLVHSTRPTPPIKLRGNQPSPPAATALLRSPVKTTYRDADSQTEKCLRGSDANTKQEKIPTGTRPIRQRSKSEPRTVPPPVSKNDMRKKLGADVLPSGGTQDTKNRVNAAAGVRQLRGFQNPFQQELKEFQDVVSREMDSVDQIHAQRPHTGHGRLSAGVQADPAKQALKSVFSVCNNLAQALGEVRAQLFGGETQTKDAHSSGSGAKMKRSSIMCTDEQGDWDRGGGTMSRNRDTNRQPRIRETTHHYELPIGRVGRFKSPQRQQPGETPVQPSRDGLRSSAYPSGAIGNPQPRTFQQSYENSADQPQYFQEAKDDTYRSFRKGKVQQQSNRCTFDSARGFQHPTRPEKEDSYDLKNVQVHPPPFGNTGGKYQQPGREDSNHLRSGGLEKNQLIFSDTGRVGGQVASFKTMADSHGTGSSTALSRPSPGCLHTTVVQILNQDNNKIGEVAILTHPLNGSGGGSGRADCVPREADSRSTTRKQSVHDESNDNTPINRAGKLQTRQEADEDHPRPSSAPGRSRDQCRPSVRPTSAPRFHRTSETSMVGRQNDALDRPTMNFITSLRRKQCIGADYADLLRAEIIRLREDRLSLEDKSLHAIFPERKELPLIRRPGWRNVY